MRDITTFELHNIERQYDRYVSRQDDIADFFPFAKKKAESDNTLVNTQNYGPYEAFGINGIPLVEVFADELTPANWELHYNSILNIMKDGIYTKYVQKECRIRVWFSHTDDDLYIDLAISDYYFNLIMWRMLIFVGAPIQPKHTFFVKELRAKSIKAFIDEFIIEEYRGTISTRSLSNIISDTLYYYHDIDQFSNYLCNTLNLEDTAELMDADKTFREALSHSYKNLQVDQVKEAIMKDTNISIDRIRMSKKLMGHEHCLTDAWRANEGINPKQYAEVTTAIGIKPDGRGGIFPEIVDTSFIGGGIYDPVNYFIESSTSRIAQIEKFKNVSKSGTLARILGLNNMDSFLYHDPTYDCHTPNLIPIEIKSDDHLKYLNLRYYREKENGVEKRIRYGRDKHLIGTTILLRSPCTCASAARGHGICYKCYGDLAYTMLDQFDGFSINIGRIATELITSKQTQKQLSAKHILEALVDKIVWSAGFYTFFEMENTVIRFKSDLENITDYRILIGSDDIESDGDCEGSESGGDDDSSDDGEMSSRDSYDEYITEFDILQKSTGEVTHIATEDGAKLFITNALNGIIRRKAIPTDDMISIPVTAALKDAPLFYIKVQNNELSKILLKLTHLFNRSNEVRGKAIPDLLQEIFDTNIEGSMDVSSIHYEVLLSNQIRDPDDVLERPDWSIKNTPYRILTLDEALTKNPSVTISLTYQKITRAFYDPLTYRKRGPSFMDLFFMKQPQKVLRDIDTKEESPKRIPGELYNPFTMLEDLDTYTYEDSTSVDGGDITDIEE